MNDTNGKIEGLSFNIVATVMSSFKSDEQKNKKIRLEENLEIKESELNINEHNTKDGYIKADRLYYFDKNKIDYFVVGQVDGDVLIRLLEKIQYLDTKGKLKQNIENIKEVVSNI